MAVTEIQTQTAGYYGETRSVDARIDKLMSIIGQQQQLLVELNANVNDLVKLTKPDTSRTNADYLNEYLKVKGSRDGSTIANYKLELNHFLEYCGDRHVLMVTTGDVSNYFAAKKCSANSLIGYMTIVKTFFNYLHESGYIRVNPAAFIVKPRQEETGRDALTFGQVKALFDAAVMPADRLLLTVLYGLGLRISEALQLTPNNFNFEANTITIKTTKNGKPLIQPLPVKVRAALIAHIAENNLNGDKAIFPFSDKTANNVQKRLCKMANLALPDGEKITQSLTNHVWRHTFVSHMNGEIHDLSVVGKLVNHSGVNVTSRYCHMSDNVSRAAMTKHPINKLL
jgi:integrase/recombinase XerD